MEKPLVTIACFTYMQESYVKEAVESLLKQSYKRLEIIISDDSSSDNTYSVVKSIVSKYEGPHKVIVRSTTKNIGLGKHVEDVLNIAKGEYILLASGDDVSYFNRVELMYEFLVQNNFKYYAIFSDLMILDKGSNEKRKYFSVKPVFAKNIQEFKAGTAVWAVGASLMIHRKLYDKYGGFVSGTIQEDGALAFRAILEGEIGYLNEVTVGYRHHDNNISQGLSIKRKIEFMKKEHLLWENWLKDLAISRSDDFCSVDIVKEGLRKSIFLKKILSIWCISHPYFYIREKLSFVKHKLKRS